MGGAERQMIGLASLLKQKGYFVDLITYHDHEFYDEIVQRYGLGSMTLHVSGSSWSKFKAVRKHIKVSGGYNWVITYKPGPSLIGCLLRMMGMKFRLIVSERNTTQHIRRKERIQFFLYRWADYVVPNSHSQGAFIKDNFPRLADKIVVITNYTDTSHFAAKYTLQGEKLKILTTARIAVQKNVLRYLEVVATLKKRGYNNLQFDWYGDLQTGQEEYGKRVEQKVKELDIDDMICFHPATPLILEQYQNCDVFCLPSSFEGFPNVVCEAMSCGKPIVCSRVCDNPHIVKEGENALMFDPNNIEDMADKLQQICNMSQEQRLKWGCRSREIAESILSMDAFIQKYIKLIEV